MIKTTFGGSHKPVKTSIAQLLRKNNKTVPNIRIKIIKIAGSNGMIKSGEGSLKQFYLL